jgi:hypothetical protein
VLLQEFLIVGGVILIVLACTVIKTLVADEVEEPGP